jgi:hypothetical protein
MKHASLIVVGWVVLVFCIKALTANAFGGERPATLDSASSFAQ